MIRVTFTSPPLASSEPDEQAERTKADTAKSATSALRVNFDFIYFPPIGVRILANWAEPS